MHLTTSLPHVGAATHAGTGASVPALPRPTAGTWPGGLHAASGTRAESDISCRGRSGGAGPFLPPAVQPAFTSSNAPGHR